MTAGATTPEAVPHHEPYHYTEWLSVWRNRKPLEVFKAQRGHTWEEVKHSVRLQAAITVCMENQEAVFRVLGQDV